MEELRNSICKRHEEKLKQLTSNDVYIYGAKTMGMDIFKKGSPLGYNFKGFIDNKSSLKEIEGLSVFSLEDIDLSTNPLIIIASRTFYDELKNSLLHRGHTNYIGSDVLAILTSTVFESPMLASLIENHDEYIKCRTIYKDEMSQRIFDNIVNYRLTLKEQFIQEAQKASKGDMYFEFEDITDIQDGVFVDGGGFDGQTTIDFINHCPNKQYKKIYYFEPDSKNMEISKKNLALYDNIDFIQKGLFTHKDTLFFNSRGTDGSHISENGDISIEVISLDEMIQEPISFIKLDIESAELPALKGMHRHIAEDTPFMAICIYHTPEEFFTIPLYLYENYGDKYDFHLRQYSSTFWDIVLYAIPKNIT